MRVLFLATYFPKPTNPAMGIWALSQAQALLRAGLDVKVVSFTSWVPPRLRGLSHAQAWADCPPHHRWGDLDVLYPRWLYYQVGRLKQWAYRHPRLAMWLAWQTGRRFLDRLTASWSPDVVYGHHTAINGYVAWQLHRRHGWPYVITDHDFAEISDCRRFPERRRIFSDVTSKAARMIALAGRMQRDLEEQFPATRCVRVPNGSDPIPDRLRAEPRPSELRDKRIICSIGMFYRRKAFPLLVRAFAPLARKRPELVLRIVGEGEDRPAIEEAILACGLAGRVQLLGAQSHEVALQELAWSDVFALVGPDEPLATVYFEAMACGKPIVCCGDGGIADYVRHETHGLIVPPNDEEAVRLALTRLVEDESLRQRCGRAGRELFERELTWDAHAGRMSRIFQQVIDEHRGGNAHAN